MATKAWFLTATTVDGWRTIDEATQAAATNTDGWVVSTGATNHSEYFVGVERAASTFTGTTVPDGALDTTNFDAFRTTNPYSGAFAAGTWVFHFVVRATTNGGAQDGRIRFRLIKANADGSGATEITAGQQLASIVTNVSTSADFDSTLSFNPGAFELANQYLFIQLAWERTGAGGMSNADINWRTGSSTTVGTRFTSTEFQPATQPPVGSLSLAGLAPALAFGLTLAVGGLALVGQPVGVAFSGPSPGSLLFTGSVPTVVVGGASGTIEVPTGSLTLTGYAPENLTQGGGTIIVPAGAFALTGEAIGVAFTGPAVSVLTLTGYAPTLSQSGLGAAITVPAGSLTLTGYLVEPVFLGPAPGTLTLTGYAPFVLFNNDVLIQIPVRTLVLTGLAPAVATGSTTITIPVRALTLTGLAPTLAFQGGSITLQVPSGALVVAGQQPNPRVDLVQVFSLIRALQQSRLG